MCQVCIDTRWCTHYLLEKQLVALQESAHNSESFVLSGIVLGHNLLDKCDSIREVVSFYCAFFGGACLLFQKLTRFSKNHEKNPHTKNFNRLAT
jgi:hypothetical protein